jgi:hypothetical protein
MPKKHAHMPETHDVEAHRRQRRRSDGSPADQPLARDADAPELELPNVRPQKFAFGLRKMNLGEWNP